MTGLLVLLVALGFLAYALVNTGHSTVSGRSLNAKFENIGSLAPGADVKIGGVAVGRVVSTSIDPQTYQVQVRFTLQPDIKLPTDSSAQVSSSGLLGGAFLTLSPGGADGVIGDGGTITITQGATNLEDLLGKFIFNVGSLADATQQSLKQKAEAPK